MALHTWGQNLEPHPHVHCLVPGGGLAPDGLRWVPSRSPKFLLPVEALSRLFRGKFLAGLKQLHRSGQLKLDGKLASLTDPQAWERWLRPLYLKDWVVYVQPPPASCPGPEAVLKYLARYVAGAAICDSRLLSHAQGWVTFRAKNYRQGRQRQVLTLTGVEFVRRFLLHVLPPGLPRVRYYGLLANKHRPALTHCRRLLGVPAEGEPPPAVAGEPARESFTDSRPAPRCGVCSRGRLQLIENTPRPTWREVLARSPFVAAATAGPAATQGLPAQPVCEDSS
jgi:putative transposase